MSVVTSLIFSVSLLSYAAMGLIIGAITIYAFLYGKPIEDCTVINCLLAGFTGLIFGLIWPAIVMIMLFRIRGGDAYHSSRSR